MSTRQRIREWWLVKNGLPPDHDELPVFNWWFVRHCAVTLVVVCAIEYLAAAYFEPLLERLFDMLF